MLNGPAAIVELFMLALPPSILGREFGDVPAHTAKAWLMSRSEGALELRDMNPTELGEAS
jgi:hypothetical protein